MNKYYSRSAQISRRTMLKLTGAGLSAVAMGGLAACAPAVPASNATNVPGASEAASLDPNSILSHIARVAEPYRGTQLNALGINSAQVLAFQHLIPEFEAATGIRVNLELGGEAEVLTKLDLELASSSGAYDIVQILSQVLPKYARAEWLTPLDVYLADAEMTDAALYNYDDIFASSIDQLSGNGNLLAAPMFVATQIFYYRKDIFEQNGITETPKTFEELRQVCEAIDGKPLKALATRGARGQTLNVWNWTAYLYGFGGEYFKSYDPTSPDYMVPILDQPEAIAAAAYYADLMQNYSPDGAAMWGWQESVRSFQQGETAMLQEGSPFGGGLMNPETSKVASEDMLACFVIPAGPRAQASPSAAHGWAIPTGAKQKEAAWLAIQWATSQEAALKSTLETPFAMVPRASVWAEDAFKEKYGWDAYLDSVVEALQIAGQRPHYLPPIPDYPSVGEEVSRYLQAVIIGESDAETAMKQANEAVRKIMQDGGYYS